MKKIINSLLLFIPLGLITIPVCHAQSPVSPNTVKSQWVYQDSHGRLVYKTMEGGDKIMDFSYAGYMGGGVSIPSVAIMITLSPSAGDNTNAIQQAINDVSKMKMKMVNGLRGAVLLRPGTYDCERALIINASGVVLRGSGSGANGTLLNLTGKPHTCIIVKGNVSSKTVGESTGLADAYVPSGSNSFNLINASGLVVGDTIRITRPVTDAWVKFMGMDQLIRDGKKQTWISGDITTERIIRKIEKNKVTIDVPLNDSYNAQYIGTPGVTIQKITTSGELSQIGIEDIRIVSPEQSVTINDSHHRAFTMSGLSDGWARNCEIFNTVNSISITGRRITVDNVNIIHNVPTIGAAKPADLNGSGQQLLFNRCSITGDNLFFFGTGAKVTGPVVVLNCIFRGNGWIQPHQRWATGLLVDGCQVPDGGIDFMNRGEMGSGHGWAIGWAVAWNCKARSYLNQLPPGSANWVIGSQGERQRRAIPFDTLPLLREGIYDSPGIPVTPSSLYLAQLYERLGKQALVNIGYSVNDVGAQSTPITEKEAKKWFKQKAWLNGAQLTPHRSINQIEFARQYQLNKKYWDKAFTFLKDHDLQTIAKGKYPIDGDNVYASITEDSSKNFDKTNWESHRKYIDLQCIITGEEKMGVWPVAKATVTKEYDEKKDVANYSAEGEFYIGTPGTFFIFFPSDAHRPNITPGGNKVVKKIVIKVRATE